MLLVWRWSIVLSDLSLPAAELQNHVNGGASSNGIGVQGIGICELLTRKNQANLMCATDNQKTNWNVMSAIWKDRLLGEDSSWEEWLDPSMVDKKVGSYLIDCDALFFLQRWLDSFNRVRALKRKCLLVNGKQNLRMRNSSLGRKLKQSITQNWPCAR